MTSLGPLRTAALSAVLLIAALVVAQVAFLRMPPVTHGSMSWALAPAGDCPRSETSDPSLRCSRVDFAPGAPVGVGFSVRNDGPVPLTIVSVASIGAESSTTLAALQPALSPIGQPLAIERLRPFAPVEIAAGDEVMIFLVGQIRPCEAVRGHWFPGTSMGFSAARITVRWLLVGTEVEMPLRIVLWIDAPVEAGCPTA
jgi:hypothetical protein